MNKFIHLAKRAYTSFNNVPLKGEDFEHVERILTPDEFELWWAMQPRDQRHSIHVLERFFNAVPWIKRTEQAAALLHDVGKIEAKLGWTLRIVATVVGPRGKRFTCYHQHEEIGARLLNGVSDPRTIELVSGKATDDVAKALVDADNI